MNKSYESVLFDMLLKREMLSTQEAMKLLGVSQSTVRRIFVALEKQGQIIRSYGGIKLAFNRPYSFDELKNRYGEEKARIGSVACGLIDSGDVVFLDDGTTTMSFAYQLSKEILEKKKQLDCVYTNSIAVLELLCNSTKVILLGGEYLPARRAFHGYLTESVIDKLHFTKCFTGTDGINNQSRFATMDSYTASINSRLIANSERAIVLCDHSKFSLSYPIGWASFKEIDTVVTDCSIRENDVIMLKAAGCKLIIA